MDIKSDKELIQEVEIFLTKFKRDNKLDFHRFEKIVCIAANNVTKTFGDKP